MNELKAINSNFDKLLLFLTIIFFITINNIHASNWYNNDWTYRKKITITDNSDTIPAQQIDFPVLINITDLNLKNNAMDTGYDILFTDSNGITKLAHEIEYYDSETGKIICWVKMPVLETGLEIFMYYGNLTSADQQNAYNVWDDNYVGVWHKNDSNTTMIKDSSWNDSHGIKVAPNQPIQIEGKIGYAQDYRGGTYSIEIPQPFGIFDGNSDFSLEVWFNAASVPVIDDWQQAPVVLSLRGENSLMLTFADGSSTPDRISIRAELGANNWTTLVESNQIDTDVWYYIAATFNTISGWVLYENGEIIDVNSIATNIFDYTGLYNVIGATRDYTRYFEGLIDEVKISNKTLSDSWIRISYNNQNDPSNFFGIGSEIKRPDIAILFPYDNYETEVINITVSGTAANCYIGDKLEIFVGNVIQDSAILSLPDTMWSFNINLQNPSDSILIKLTNIYNDIYYDTITITKLPPDKPIGIDATAILEDTDTGVLLSWSHNNDPDTAGYNIYRTSNPPNFSDTINQFLITDTNYFLDTNVVQGETYFYKITCIDKVGNESFKSDSTTGASVKIKLSVDTYGHTLPGDTLTLYIIYYNDGFGPAYGANLFYNIPENLIFDTFIENTNVYTTYDTFLKRLDWDFTKPILPKLESDSKNIEVILKIK